MPRLLARESARLLELRRSRRFPISVPAFFSWLDQDGMMHDQSGTTRDVSMAGAFIEADIVPNLGAPVGVDIYLSVDVAGRVVELRGEGKVARIEGCGQTKSGFAAEVIFQTPSSNDSSSLAGPHEAQ